MNIGIIIQARLGSTRLPNKILKPFLGETILSFLIKRLQSLDYPIFVATTNNSNDDSLAEYLEEINIKYYRGSEEDVLQRYIDTANHFKIDHIIRICSDSPFLDKNLLENLIKLSQKEEQIDYLSYSIDSRPTVLSHIGVFGEFVSLQALKMLKSRFHKQEYNEHVTFGIYNNRHIFNVKLLPIDDTFSSYKSIRLTLDTEEDYQNLNIIANKTSNIKNISAVEICKLVDTDSHLKTSMSQIITKNTK